MKTMFDEIQQSVKNWWLSLILGVIFVAVGIGLLFTPAQSYIVLSVLFSIAILISGIFEIAFAVSNKHISSWGWYLAGGIIDIIIGVYLLVFPTISMEVIPYFIAFWLMFRGFSSIGYATDLRRYGTTEWGWYLAFGIFAIFCSLIILWHPVIGALYAIYMISFAFIVFGSFRIMLAFELKNLHKRSNNQN